jgi:hypothetical protein
MKNLLLLFTAIVFASVALTWTAVAQVSFHDWIGHLLSATPQSQQILP